MSMSVEECAVTRTPRSVPNPPENVLERFGMSNRVVVITGALDGIGYVVAEAMV